MHEFDVNITPEQLKDTDKLAKERVYPDIRKAEARFIPSTLRATLESSGQWGAVRVVPTNVEFVDVSVSGRILESTGAKLALEVTVHDSTGRVWINKKKYESPADTGSYKTDASLRARDPFQNVYSQIANDMVAARDALLAENRRDIRRVTELRFAQDLAPKAMDGYVVKDAKGMMTVARLPAKDDPYTTRIERIRERDGAVVDTVNGYYANFSDSMKDSVRQLAPFELRRDREGNARSEQGAHAHVPRRCGGAGERVRAGPVRVQRLQLPSHRERGTHRWRHRRYGRRAVGPEEIFRREGSCAGAEGIVGNLPERSAAAGGGRRGPHAAPHRHGGRAVQGMA